jgi:hypothetical protein
MVKLKRGLDLAMTHSKVHIRKNNPGHIRTFDILSNPICSENTEKELRITSRNAEHGDHVEGSDGDIENMLGERRSKADKNGSKRVRYQQAGYEFNLIYWRAEGVSQRYKQRVHCGSNRKDGVRIIRTRVASKNHAVTSATWYFPLFATPVLK